MLLRIGSNADRDATGGASWEVPTVPRGFVLNRFAPNGLARTGFVLGRFVPNRFAIVLVVDCATEALPNAAPNAHLARYPTENTRVCETGDKQSSQKEPFTVAAYLV